LVGAAIPVAGWLPAGEFGRAVLREGLHALAEVGAAGAEFHRVGLGGQVVVQVTVGCGVQARLDVTE